MSKRDTSLSEQSRFPLEELDNQQSRINKESTGRRWAFWERQLGVTGQTRSAPCLAQQCVPSVW